MALEFEFIKSTGRDAGGLGVVETWGVRTKDGESELAPLRILQHTDCPKNGSPYASDRDVVTGALWITGVELGDIQSSGVYCYRHITVTYGGTTPPRPGGQPQSFDPLLWFPELEIFDSPRAINPTRLLFLGGFTHNTASESISPCGGVAAPTLVDVANSAVVRPKNTVAPIANTVGQELALDSPLETYDTGYRITMYHSAWDPQNVYRCVNGIGINSTPTRIKIDAWQFDKTFPVHTLWIRSIRGTPQWKQWTNLANQVITRIYYPTTYEILYRPTGWHEDVINRGNQRIVDGHTQDAPDGMGGTIPYSEFQPGAPPVGPIVDSISGLAVGEPVLLNEDGFPIAERDTVFVLRYLRGVPYDFYTNGVGLPLASV